MVWNCRTTAELVAFEVGLLALSAAVPGFRLGGSHPAQAQMPVLAHPGVTQALTVIVREADRSRRVEISKVLLLWGSDNISRSIIVADSTPYSVLEIIKLDTHTNCRYLLCCLATM